MDGTVDGTAGDDHLTIGTADAQGDRVTWGDDVIDAGAGDDRVYAGAGDDTVYGGDGDDIVGGGFGDDTIYGGAGSNVLSGGLGDDTIVGGDGEDVIFGGFGDDVIRAGVGDVVFGGFSLTAEDEDVLDLRGQDYLSIELSDFPWQSGVVTYADGRTLTFYDIEKILTGTLPCFTPGTLIATPEGERRVEDLRAGDRVITRDNGIQEVRWTGVRELSGRDLLAAPRLRPVLVTAGALGHGLPERDMMVSPNHRFLVMNERTALYFEEAEVFVAAKHLVGRPGIQQVDVVSVTYVHFMCDRHEVVLSDGAWTESFQPGEGSLKGVDADQREELLLLFPELRTHEGVAAYQSARRSLRRHEAMLLGA